MLQEIGKENRFDCDYHLILRLKNESREEKKKRVMKETVMRKEEGLAR